VSSIPVVIPAAGLGVRLARVTGGDPKELVELAGRPVLLASLLEVAAAGVPEVALVTTDRKPKIRAAVERLCGELAELGDLSVRFVDQPEPRGVSDAVDRAARALDADRVAVVFPDYVCLPDQRALRGLLQAVERLPADATSYLVLQRTEHVAATHGSTSRVAGVVRDGVLAVGRVGAPPASPAPWHTTFCEVQGTAHRARMRGGVDRDIPALLQELADRERLFGVPAPGPVLDVGIPAGHADAVQRFESGEARWRIATSS